jgi:hypothetical protein
MPTTTTAQQTAMESSYVPWLVFVEMFFTTSTYRFTNNNVNLPWGGYTWIGVGALGDITEIKSSEKIEPSAITLSLNLAQTPWRTLGFGSVDEYRGKVINIYRAPLDVNRQIIDTPVLEWTGTMDVIGLSAEGSSSSISMRCEPQIKALRRPSNFRVNAAQQAMRYPSDTGFERHEDLIKNPQTWLSKNFQRVQ